MTSTEFGRAVRRRRDRVSPEAAGLPAGGHRRAAGLRREELALLTGISADYVTRREQGRAAKPSEQVVEALGRRCACPERHPEAGRTGSVHTDLLGSPSTHVGYCLPSCRRSHRLRRSPPSSARSHW